jgi:hypothetical protein
MNEEAIERKRIEAIERKRLLLNAAEGKVHDALSLFEKAIGEDSGAIDRAWSLNVGFRLKECIWFIDLMKRDVDKEEREVMKPSVPDDIETRMAELEAEMKDVKGGVTRLERGVSFLDLRAF